MKVEEAWQELLAHAEWSQGPWLGWIFAEAEAPLELLRGRLTQLLKERDEELRLLRPSTAEEANHLLENLFADQILERGGVWLTLVGRDAAWEQAWRRFHHLLNERRERLMRHLRGPLIIVGPPGWKEAARDAAPDLWTLRTVLIELDPIPSPLPFSPMPLHLPADDDAPDPELATVAVKRARARGRPAAEAEARLELAAGLLAQGETAKARAEAEQAFVLAGSDILRARARAMHATVALHQGDHVAAMEHWKAAIQLAPSGRESLAWRNHCIGLWLRFPSLDTHGGMSLLAAMGVALARRIAPDLLPNALERMGAVAAQSRKWSESEEYNLEGLARLRSPGGAQGPHDRSAALWYGVAVAQHALGRNAEAVESFTKALEWTPSPRRDLRANVLSQRSVVKSLAGDQQGSQEDLQHALELFEGSTGPKHALALAKAALLHRDSDPERARSYFEKALVALGEGGQGTLAEQRAAEALVASAAEKLWRPDALTGGSDLDLSATLRSLRRLYSKHQTPQFRDPLLLHLILSAQRHLHSGDMAAAHKEAREVWEHGLAAIREQSVFSNTKNVLGVALFALGASTLSLPVPFWNEIAEVEQWTRQNLAQPENRALLATILVLRAAVAVDAGSMAEAITLLEEAASYTRDLALLPLILTMLSQLPGPHVQAAAAELEALNARLPQLQEGIQKFKQALLFPPEVPPT